MHVHPLPVSPISVQYRRDDDQLLLGDEIPHASLVLLGVVWLHRVQVELEGGGEGQEQQQHAADEAR